jgi:hypothetical protein
MDLAEEFKGEFLESGHGVTVRVPVADKPWRLAFKMHTNGFAKVATETTVVAAPFVARHPFKFSIRNSGTMEELVKILGMQDIVIGHDAFDKEYIIQGNHPEQVKEFFACAELREKIQAQKAINLSIVDSRAKQLGMTPPPHENVLTFVEKGAINSYGRVTSLLELMVHTLERLQGLGIASAEVAEYAP